MDYDLLFIRYRELFDMWGRVVSAHEGSRFAFFHYLNGVTNGRNESFLTSTWNKFVLDAILDR